MSEVEATAPAAEALLDLATPRTIVLDDHQNDHQYILRCRRITENDWKQYFAGIVVSSEQSGKERVNVIDVSSARLVLAEAVLQSAEGYKVVGGAELSTLSDWKKKVPLAHRRKLGDVLVDARLSVNDSEILIYPEGEVVSLDATWSAAYHDGTDEPEPYDPFYAMEAFLGLKHLLRTPSEEQHRRYASQSSRSRVVGGSRSGKTIYPGAQMLLATLYDELVVRVEGYCVNGEPLADRTVIVREMDLLHKVTAAQEIFQPQDTAQLAGGE